jgi:hypothetical protein
VVTGKGEVTGKLHSGWSEVVVWATWADKRSDKRSSSFVTVKKSPGVLYAQWEMVDRPLWEFWAEARNERRARMGSLCERRGRHVTRSFCGPLPPSSLPLSPLDGSKNLRSALILPTHHSRLKFQSNFDDEPRGPRTISPLQVGPPTRCELAPGRAPLIFDREALRAPTH